MSVRVRLLLRKEEVEGVLINNVKTIKLQDDNKTYIFPKEYQGEQTHVELKQISIVKSAFKSMTKEGHYRNVNITLPKKIKKIISFLKNFYQKKNQPKA